MTWRGNDVYYNGTTDIHSVRDISNTAINSTTELNNQSALSFWAVAKIEASSFAADHPLIGNGGYRSLAPTGTYGSELWFDDVAGVSGNTDTVTFSWIIAGVGTTANGRVEGPTGLVTPGRWYSIIGTFLGSTYGKLFVNGQLVATNTSVTATSEINYGSTSIQVGSWAPTVAGGVYANISLRAFGIWQSALPDNIALELSADPFGWW
jgi:hypothetical protein